MRIPQPFSATRRATTARSAAGPARFPRPARRRLALALAAGLCLAPAAAQAFTQSGAGTFISNAIPMGHEWVTRMAALELLGGDPILKPDPEDPRRNWTRGLAKNLDLSAPEAQREVARIKAQHYGDQRYQSTYKAVYDAIVGERWVDIGGFNVSKARVTESKDCHDAVTQEAVDVQYDHFMRRYDDRDGQGGVQAAQRSRARFIEYFVNAATAPPTLMKVWDGGGYSALTEVDRNYFLFGRAVHLFEDSFSSEHTVRIADDNHERVRQVKSYLCAAGSEQHSHSTSAVLGYGSGDVIWNPGTQFDPGWVTYKPSNMKDLALVATEATKDLWAAFIRTMGVPLAERAAKARAEATTLAENWLAMDDAEAGAWYQNPVHRDRTYVRATGETSGGQSVADCMRGVGEPSGDQAKKAREFEATRRLCLYNVVPEPGYADLFDTSLRMPFNWTWRNALKFEQPPAGWRIPERPADTGTRVRIKSVMNGQYLGAPDGIGDDAWIYARAGTPLEFIQVGGSAAAIFRLASASLFLSYRGTTGAVKLYGTPDQASFRIEPLTGGRQAIKNLHWNQYMWLYKESPYITRTGNPRNADAQWMIESAPPR